MRVETLQDHLRPLEHETVKFKDMNSHVEIRYCKTKAACHTRKLDANNYMVLETGEVKQYRHTTSRAENIKNVKQSMARLRDLIRANINSPNCCRWVSLTYATVQSDYKKLYEDYRRFNQRFQRYLKRNHNTTAEWIAVAEPQARGAWHMHVIYIFKDKAPFIPNDDLAKIWNHGFTKIKALKSGDDVALYLSAYLCDVELGEALESGTQISDIKPQNIKVVGEGQDSKAFIKGGRLGMYPTGMRLYRCSRGIRKPVVFETSERGSTDAQRHQRHNQFVLRENHRSL